MNEILEQLTGGDLRSEGRAAEVAAQVIDDPGRLARLAEGLALDDRLVRARTCMALEVISRTHAPMLAPLVPELLRTAKNETVAQARWHLAEILGNVSLDRRQSGRAVTALLAYLDDKSKIVTHCAVMTLGVVGKRAGRVKDIAAAIRAHAEDSRSIGKAVARALEELGAD